MLADQEFRMLAVPANPKRPSSLVIFTVYFALVSIWAVRSDSREVRPSEHGLSFQKAPETAASSGMKSFFKGTASPSSDPALPAAKNSSDGFWSPGRFGHVRKGEGHVSVIMLVASLVCAVGGVVLLVAAAALYFFRIRRRK